MSTETLAEIARDIEAVWTYWVDEDIYDAAINAVEAIQELVARIGGAK